MGKVQKERRWVPHELSEDNKNRRRNTAFTLLSKFRKKDFVHKIIIGNERWILYDNSKRRKLWVEPSTSTPKPNIYAKKVEEKRPFTGQGCRIVILLHDNARPHVAKGPYLCIKLGTFPVCVWRISQTWRLAITTYSGHLADIHFVRFEKIRKCIDEFIVTKTVSFYCQEIRKVPERKSLIQTGNISLVNIFCLFLNKD